MHTRGVVVVALLAFLSACEAPPQPADAPPPPPAPREQAASEADATSPSPAPAPAEPPAAPSASAATPAPEPPPKATWRTVDLGGSSVDVPEPAAEATTGPVSGAPGIRTVRAAIDGIEFYAGDGPFRTFDAKIARRLLGDQIADRIEPRIFDADASREPAGAAVRDRGFDHDGGSHTLVCLAFWSTGNAMPGRVAWRVVTVGPAGQGEHKDKVFQFLESHPGPKRPGLNYWATRSTGIKRLTVCF